MANLPSGAEEIDLEHLDKAIPDPTSRLNFERLRLLLGLRRDGTALGWVNDDLFATFDW